MFKLQWNLGLKNTQGTVKNCPEFWGGLISQVHFYVLKRHRDWSSCPWFQVVPLLKAGYTVISDKDYHISFSWNTMERNLGTWNTKTHNIQYLWSFSVQWQLAWFNVLVCNSNMRHIYESMTLVMHMWGTFHILTVCRLGGGCHPAHLFENRYDRMFHLP